MTPRSCSMHWSHTRANHLGRKAKLGWGKPTGTKPISELGVSIPSIWRLLPLHHPPPAEWADENNLCQGPYKVFWSRCCGELRAWSDIEELRSFTAFQVIDIHPEFCLATGFWWLWKREWSWQLYATVPHLNPLHALSQNIISWWLTTSAQFIWNVSGCSEPHMQMSFGWSWGNSQLQVFGNDGMSHFIASIITLG